MNAVELSKAYAPKEFEDRIYHQWLESGSFAPTEGGQTPYTVVMPPPNVTGILHMGHALNNSLPDILIRYNRMKGNPTLWVPGTDHAGIATQNVVERQLAKEGLTRADLGREKFLERTWEVKEKHHAIIKEQLMKMGCSCDWNHERFTMDEGLSAAVREAFVTLYNRDLIYKGEYLVNYCPSCGTALADDEVEHQSRQAAIYQVSYPFSEAEGAIVVATTRPETMFGDVAVAVNPNDERYAHLVGTFVNLPLTDRKIPIIADEFVDIEFGTGFVKITPAHDPNDYQAALRHDLPKINILNADGTLNTEVPAQFQGLKADVARKAVVAALKEEGYLKSEEPYTHEVGHCYRCHNVVEPYLSNQWFVRMEGMAKKALNALYEGKIVFHPKHWENTYIHWLENIHDWCISRQLWWGHRIPVWECQECHEMIASTSEVTECPHCKASKLVQESDVLDTWFSSWLWPFSTLGWPEQTPDLKRFFPTNSLTTGYDIIFFWVARMIMASLEFLGEVPFKDIYITGLVRDKQGRKMSKSLGNGIDPLEVIDQYGADAMKFTLAYMATQGQDILIDMDTFRLGSRFANKVWNAARFVLLNIGGVDLIDVDSIELNTIDKWIYHRFNVAVKKVHASMESFKFNEGSQSVYDFFWNDFCDWYLEAAKEGMYSSDQGVKNRQISLLVDLLERSMALMHPYLSFITEEIYSKLPTKKGQLINHPFPVEDESLIFNEEHTIFTRFQEAVTSIRALRSDLQIPLDRKVRVAIASDEGFIGSEFFKANERLLALFTNALSVEVDRSVDVGEALPVAGSGYQSFVFVGDALDIEKEIAKLEGEIAKTEKNLDSTAKKLAHEGFLKNAKEEAIAKEHAKRAEFEEKLQKSGQHLTLLKTLR
ncbi:MAG: valine--tRNA ligase [Sphaerochaeta sp.]